MHAKYLKHLDSEAYAIAKDYLSNPNGYVRQFNVVINGKIRKITTYSNDENGRKLRDIHSRIVMLLQSQYAYSECSYAYQKGIGVKDCIEAHIHSCYFLKTDIHKYFDSISFDRMIQKIEHTEGLTKFFLNRKAFIQACFYEDKLPIGFVSSPILSDIYLHDFDLEMEGEQGVVYTRYADDLILSTSSGEDKERLESIKEKIAYLLEKEALQLNSKKTYLRRLGSEGDAIHLLGINLVKTSGEENRITISGKYLVETSKKIAELMSGTASNADSLCLEVCGRIEFIRYFSTESFDKLARIFKAHTKMEFAPTHSTIQRMYESMKSVPDKPNVKENQVTAEQVLERIKKGGEKQGESVFKSLYESRRH